MTHDEPFLVAREITLKRGVGGARKTILHGVSLSLHRGETAILRGVSGSGKSSLLWALARLLPLDSGTLLLEGKPSAEWPVPLWREQAALVLQKHALLPGTVRDNLLLPWKLNVRRAAGGTPPEDSALRQELDSLALEDVAVTAEATRLSVGQTARISLARTLLTNPSCLLIDEPTAALDRETATRVLARIDTFATAGGAVLMARHDGRATVRCRMLTITGSAIREENP